MNITRNEPLIRRNARIGQVAMIGGLVCLAGGMFVSFRYPEQLGLMLAALMFGFLLSQIGIYFSNRWGRSPRPDQLLDQALKGLDKKYALYHYSSPISHLLVGPAGVWVLQPFHQRGVISFTNGRWRQKGGNPLLKVFGQENLGRPDMELRGEIERLQRFFQERLPEGDLPEIQAALVFTHPDVQINISDEQSPPAETVPLKKLKDTVRKAAKGKALSLDRVDQIRTLFEGDSQESEREQ